MSPLSKMLGLVFLLLLGCGRTEALQPTSAPDGLTQVQRELLARWNQAAMGTAFQWEQLDSFPHPTFRGGSRLAYQTFVGVLIRFLESSGNLNFLRTFNLFTTPWRLSSFTPTTVSFCELVREMSASSLVNAVDQDHLQRVLKTLNC
jgi:hypothetical protein